jgi:hypothetical protein
MIAASTSGALGVCTYELVTGRLPFDGDNPLEVLSHITSDDPPAIEGDVPLSVRGIVFKALARNPDERFPTAAAMRRAIESALSQLPIDNSSEDLAAFVDAHMPHRATERKEIVSRALKAAEARTQGGVDAFTGTVEVSSRTRGAPTRVERAGMQATPASSPQLLAQRVRPLVPKLSARALVEEEPTSRTPLWIVLGLAAVGLGAFLSWRANPTRWGSQHESVAQPPAPTAEVTAKIADAPVGAALPSASASEVSPGASEVPPTSEAPNVEATASAAAPHKPPHKHGWPSATFEPSAPPRNTDWLPKQSELPTIAPPSGGNPAN